MNFRTESHTRAKFAHDQALNKWLPQVNHAVRVGNILLCKGFAKLKQAQRIYDHYNSEWCNDRGITPFVKERENKDNNKK